MAIRPTIVLAVLCGLAAGALAGTQDIEPDEARKKAKRVTSYITFCETVGRVGIQVGGMVEHNPYDKALITYAREIGRLHVRLYSKLTPPEGAETIHKHFKEAITEFAKAAEAHSSADYATGHKHRKQAIADFLKAIAEINKLRRKGTIPGYQPAGGGKK
ncbi:MAG: hypothetical protein ISS72_11515 [Candidatus Brocadiae bacterium]|nr:hypothetical protein [Candidatus Brocadiia bacterium]